MINNPNSKNYLIKQNGSKVSNKNNDRHILQCKKTLQEITNILTEFCVVVVNLPILSAYSGLIDYTKTLSEMSTVGDISKFINWVKPKGLKVGMETAIHEVANFIVDDYIKHRSDMSKKARVIAILKQDVELGYMQLNELAQLQTQLNFILPKVKQVSKEDNIDRGSVANCFGKGA